MRIAYTTTFDANDVHNWSGTPYYMSQAFHAADCEVEYIGSLKRKLPPFFKAKQFFKKMVGQRESPRFNFTAARAYSEQVQRRLANLSVDAIVSPLINPIAQLDCKQPIILWTDSLYAALVGFYPSFNTHSADSIMQGNALTSDCLARTSLAIFSSDWAANSALELYGAAREKVKVVPFGANIETYPSLEEVKAMIQKRPASPIKLLFLAKSWERKGGDIVLAVTKALHASGHPVELTIVGYEPEDKASFPSYIHCLGYISKHTEAGRKKISQLLSETHFLFVPSRGEAYGIVFCEANAYGVPCLTTYVGGISTIIKDHVNGMTFALDASVERYCEYIVKATENSANYQQFALNAYDEFITRLNWPVAVKKVKSLIEEIL